MTSVTSYGTLGRPERGNHVCGLHCRADPKWFADANLARFGFRVCENRASNERGGGLEFISEVRWKSRGVWRPVKRVCVSLEDEESVLR